MGRLNVGTFVSLDGVMQAPGQPEEDRDGGFEHGGWQVPFFDDPKFAEIMGESLGSLQALLLGRKTYELFAGYWPNAPEEDPAAFALNRAPKYVASRTLDAVEWQNSTLLDGPVEDAVARLKDAYAEIQVIGSGNLVQTLLRADLVDVFTVWLYPVLLGSGKRLFAEGTTPGTLRLTESVTTPTGAVLLRYERSGPLRYGTTAR